MAYEYDESYLSAEAEQPPTGPPGRGRRRAPETPQQSEQPYPDQQYGEDPFTQSQYGDPQYSVPAYGTPQFPEPQYGDPQYRGDPQFGGDPQYGDSPYSESEYGDQQYGDPQYGDPRSQVPQVPAQREQPPQQQQWDPQWDESGLGWDRREWDEAQHREPQPEFLAPGNVPPEYGQSDYSAPNYGAPDFQADPEQTESSSAPRSAPAEVSLSRGAFGAAGLSVLTAIGAVAAAPVLAIVVGASQLGLAAGWSRAANAAWRSAVLPALLGICATALAYRGSASDAAGISASVLGLGFVALSVERLVAGPRSIDSLADAVAGAVLVIVPAGYVVAERQDSALTAGCALAGAMAVLCSALISGPARGIGVGVVAATLVGGLTAVSLNSGAGLTGGLAGGALAGLFAATGVATAGRLAAEGAQTRILGQALPVALTALAAVVSVTVLR